MRNYLLASAAMLALTAGTARAAIIAAPDDGSGLLTSWNAPKTTPDPGKVNVRLDGFVDTEFGFVGTTTDKGLAGTPNAAAKDAPYGMAGLMRMYFGIDGRMTNGLIYGANVEMRTDFGGPNGGLPNVTATALGSASSQSTASVWYTRRAFVYLGGDNWGIVRIGSNDGPVGIFDESGVTTGEAFDTGGWDGDNPNFTGNAGLDWPFFDTGNEYDPAKITYMTPTLGTGFMFGVSFAPSNSINQATGGTAAAAGAGDRQETSLLASDASRPRNIVEIGGRYKGPVGPITLEAYTGYVHAQPVQNAIVGGQQYYDLSESDTGLAVTFAGATVFGHLTYGQFNTGNSEAMMPKIPGRKVNGTAYIAGAMYTIGPWSVGAAMFGLVGEGSIGATGTGPIATAGSNKTEGGAWIGGTYVIAKGVTSTLEYLYGTKHQANEDYVDSTASEKLGNRATSNSVVANLTVAW